MKCATHHNLHHPSQQCSSPPQWNGDVCMDDMGQCGSMEQRRICPWTRYWHVLWISWGIWHLHSPHFFYHYLQLNPLIFPAPCTIHIYCDNSGMIQKLQHNSSQQYPRNAIQDNYPIHAEIHQQIWEHPKITVSFHHVKGHQREMADQKLTLPEKLNIDCDAWAAALHPLPTNSPYCHNPLPQAGFPHLLIKDQCIVQQLQHQLCDAATQQPYFDYLTSKFQWTENAKTTVYWPAIQLALRWFKATEWCMLQKFMHEWLPLQDCYHVQSTSTNHVCPSCWQAIEMADHFLACRHPARQQIWKEMHDSLFQHQIKHDVSNIFHDILAFGLYQGWQEPTTI